MVKLKNMQKKFLEDVLEMKGGYTDLEPNRFFYNFFEDLGFIKKYPFLADEDYSKAIRLRRFFMESTKSDFIKFLNYVLEVKSKSIKDLEGFKNFVANFSLDEPVVVEKSFETTDSDLNELLEQAKDHFKNNRKQEALEKIWDAFERLKTFLHNDKKNGSSKLVELLSSDLEQEIFESEFRALTSIGNDYTIRHHENGKKKLGDEHTKDYLFNRVLSLIDFSIKKLGF